MINEVFILKGGLCVFHRAYDNMAIEKVRLTSNFFQAILYFSTELSEKPVESISMAESTFHFNVKQGFTFVIRERKGSTMSLELVKTLLDQLSNRFHERFPNAENWNGNRRFFDDFTTLCDQIIQKSPVRQGFPILFRTFLNPFYAAPIIEVTSISPDNQRCLYELQHELTKYVHMIGLDRTKRDSRFRNPFILSLPKNQQFAYVYGIIMNSTPSNFSHMLCFLIPEENLYTFYRLLPSIRRKASNNLAIFANYIHMIEKDPTVQKVTQHTDKIWLGILKEMFYNWGDLNQYVGILQTSLIEELIRAGIPRKNLAETQMRTQFLKLLTRLGEDIDKLLFALLTHQPIVFVGENKAEVEQSISPLLTFYPHSSMTLWTDKPQDHLLVGTHIQNLDYYRPKSALIIDLSNNRIKGGQKNVFCYELMDKIRKIVLESSISEARMAFETDIRSLFTTIRALLAISTEDNKKQQRIKFKTILEKYSPDAIHLITSITRELNILVATNIQKFLGFSKRAFQ